ncbi:MAG: hypothetical protein OEM67_11800 [Thermoleophilia bacterium]|nr:hypothetical protein [Thermoleophilia bacterium]MDH3724833.1 hypothetical protein [Thermoleophilia bacterium]
MTANTYNALSRMAAAAFAGALLLSAWFVLTARGAADDATAVADLRARATCLLRVDGATLRLNSVFLSKLDAARIGVRTIAPARTAAGRNVRVPVRGASGVPCDADEGVIGMRGGLELVRGTTSLRLRRWRVAVDDNRVDAHLSQENSVPVAALAVDLGAAERIMIGGDLSLRASMLLAEGGSAAINRAFGTRLPTGMPVARLALAVREVASEDAG